ncbi:AraC-type DNA-binding protein [Flavobacteriaceae bacterium MAR_2010_188]|nr:AraC-type DNA-binding protein [Flavobacteriaceae bacterium MAR_2010_188]
MRKFKVKVSNSLDMLKRLAVETDSLINEDYGSAVMIWNKALGDGISRAFEILPGLSVIIYDVELKEDFLFTKDESIANTLYLMYCLEGNVLHKFGNEKIYESVNEKQNVFLQGEKHRSNDVLIPAKSRVKLSVIYIVESLLETHRDFKGGYLSSGLQELFNFIGTDRPYRYFGPLNSKIAHFAKQLYVGKNIDFVNRLLMEASVLQLLANQISSLQSPKSESIVGEKLSTKELKRVLDLSNHIVNNLDKNYSILHYTKYAGISAAKVQAGFKHYFNETINTFTRNARMAKTKELIETTNLNFSEISYLVGISSRSYFSKEFQNYYGVTPTKYRKSIENIKPHFELSYHSVANSGNTDEDVRNILISSKENNTNRNITGCLINYNDSFFQILEGSKNDILSLMKKIKSDDRHSDLEIIWSGFRSHRSFHNFSMAYINNDEVRTISDRNKAIDTDVLDIIKTHQRKTIPVSRFWEQVKNQLMVHMESVAS